jgi:hypothetical protein
MSVLTKIKDMFRGERGTTRDEHIEAPSVGETIEDAYRPDGEDVRPDSGSGQVI